MSKRNIGIAYGGPYADAELDSAEERVDVFKDTTDELLGAYHFDEDKWLWQPNDAMSATAG